MQTFLVSFSLLFLLWHKTWARCTSIAFNGSSMTDCSPGLNDNNYEKGVLQTNQLSKCEIKTTLSTDGHLHCLKKTPEKKLKEATLGNFEREFASGLERLSSDSEEESLNLYLTDHAGEGGATDNPEGKDNLVTTFGDDGNESISYIDISSKLSKMIRENKLPAGKTIKFNMDHCFSGLGLEKIVNALPDDSSQSPSICGISAAAADELSASTLSLSDVNFDFNKRYNRLPNTYELYLSATTDSCFHSTPQLSSNIFVKNRVLRSRLKGTKELFPPENKSTLNRENQNKKTLYNYAEKAYSCYQDSNIFQKNGAEVYNVAESILLSESKKVLQDRIKNQVQLLKSLLKDSKILECKNLSQPNFFRKCINELKAKITKKQKIASDLEKKNEEKLESHPYSKKLKELNNYYSMLDPHFLTSEPKIKANALELSKEFSSITKEMLNELTKKINGEKNPEIKKQLSENKKELEFNTLGTKNCRAKQSEHYSYVALVCGLPVELNDKVGQNNLKEMFDVEKESKELKKLREALYAEDLSVAPSGYKVDKKIHRERVKRIDIELDDINSRMKDITLTMGSQAIYMKLFEKKRALMKERREAEEQIKQINKRNSKSRISFELKQRILHLEKMIDEKFKKKISKNPDRSKNKYFDYEIREGLFSGRYFTHLKKTKSGIKLSFPHQIKKNQLCHDLVSGRKKSPIKNVPPPKTIKDVTCLPYDCECFKSNVLYHRIDPTEPSHGLLFSKIANKKIEEIKTSKDLKILKKKFLKEDQKGLVQSENYLNKIRGEKKVLDQVQILGGLTSLLEEGTNLELIKFGNMAKCEQGDIKFSKQKIIPSTKKNCKKVRGF